MEVEIDTPSSDQFVKQSLGIPHEHPPPPKGQVVYDIALDDMGHVEVEDVFPFALEVIDVLQRPCEIQLLEVRVHISVGLRPVVAALYRKAFRRSPSDAGLDALVVSVSERSAHGIQRAISSSNLRIGRNTGISSTDAIVVTVVGSWERSVDHIVLHVRDGWLIIAKDAALKVIAVALDPIHFDGSYMIELALYAKVILLRVSGRERSWVDTHRAILGIVRCLDLGDGWVISPSPIKIAFRARFTF